VQALLASAATEAAAAAPTGGSGPVHRRQGEKAGRRQQRWAASAGLPGV
jgi:hypothetical protein